MEEELGVLTLSKVVTLAAVDAINPCALAVLTMMLISIIAYNPNKRMNIVWAGLAFSLSVFLMYLVYGVLIVKAFQMIQAITSVKIILYKAMGGLAILLGLLQIKDFWSYKPGSLATEMPMSMRPKAKKIIGKITSPAGAFGIGIFVTLFLLPCTIGPYIILAGMLSYMDIIETLPHLLLYNLIFIAPMLFITGIVYFGISKVEDVSAWKDKHIRLLHLVAGGIILALGVAMVMGWV